MLTFTEAVEQMSVRVRSIVSDDPLIRPIGRTPDGVIDAALAVRGLVRSDLFLPETSLAPHRRRLASMLATEGLSVLELAADHWSELKAADHRCKQCVETRRCERWLRSEGEDDSPRKFCPNAQMIERLKTRPLDA